MYYFIVNPHAGRGKGLDVWQQAEDILKLQNITYEVLFTTDKGEAVQLASEAAQQDQVTAVVAVGGDGTVHEVANGLYGTEIPLGYLPAGTGNDFAREWEISFDPAKAIERILLHQVKTTDILIADKRVMLCYLSTGFDGYVSRRVDASWWKKWLGKASYFVGALISLPRFQPYTLRLALDGKDYTFEDVWLVTLSNGKSFGGGMIISPHADPTDGQIDVCVIRNLSKAGFLQVFPKVYAGKHVGHKAVTFLQGKTAKVEASPAMWAFADGEEVGPESIEIELKPSGLLIL